METKIYSQTGEKIGTTNLPEAVFGAAWNPDLVHEVVVAMQGNARAGTAHAKDRSEVRGGGQKPWRQKGTGRARHGSRRSPIWTGGGVTHGPLKDKDYSRKLNRKVRAKALASTLSKKFSDGEIIFVESIKFEEPKTAIAKTILTALAQATELPSLADKRRNGALVVLPERDITVEKSFRNFGNLSVVQAKDVNSVDLLTFKYVIVVGPDQSVKTLSQRASTKVPTTTT